MKFIIMRISIKANRALVDLYNKEEQLNVELYLSDCRYKNFVYVYQPFFHTLTHKMKTNAELTSDDVIQLFNAYKHSLNTNDMFVRNIISYDR